MGARVQRSDISRLGKFARNGAGAVRIPATISRTGLQQYGELIEYRPDSEVFSDASLASLASVPVTLRHPPESVTPANVAEYQIGHVTDVAPEARVKVDGSGDEWLRTSLIVSRGDALDEIDRAPTALEVSCGYTCDLDMTPGVTLDGRAYDAIQRNIVFNHVAILTADQRARAGAEAKLRLDNQIMKIVIDGVEFDKGSDAHLDRVRQDHQKALAAETARADKAEARADGEKERADKATAQVANLDGLVSARMALLKRAAKLLPGDYNTSGKSDAQVRSDAVAAKLGADKLTGKSEAYVEARFDSLTEDDGEAQYHKPEALKVDAAVSINDSDDAFRAGLAAKRAQENK